MRRLSLKGSIVLNLDRHDTVEDKINPGQYVKVQKSYYEKIALSIIIHCGKVALKRNKERNNQILANYQPDYNKILK